MKLSLYSQLVQNGENHSTVFNDGEMRNKLFDVRIEGALKLSAERSGVFCLLSVNSLGCLVYAIEPLFSRMGDYSALILAVPRQVIFSAAADIPRIYEAMRQVVANDSGTALLKRFFEKDYPERDFEWPRMESSRKYAYRLYGGRSKVPSLNDLLGTTMLQEKYGEYEGVFLLEETQADLVRTMDDLTSQALKKPALVSPPAKSRLPKGTALYVGANEMTAPLLSHIGDYVRYSLKRNGFEDYEGKHPVQQSVEQLQLPVSIPWNYKVYTSFFSVADDEGGEKLGAIHNNLRIDVDGILSTHKNYFLLPETLARTAHVRVTADFYEPFDAKNVNLMAYSKEHPMEIILKKKRETVKYRIDQRSPKITFALNRALDDKMVSPLKGYEVGEERNGEVLLRWTGKESRADKDGREKKDAQGKVSTFKVSKEKLMLVGITLLTGILLGGAAGWLFGVPHGEDKYKNLLAEQQKKEQQLEQQRKDSLTHTRIVAFLDSVPKWRKNEMDSVFDGRLKGLYDQLNYYSFEKLNESIDSLRLLDSKEIQRLDSAISLMDKDTEYLPKLIEITNNEDENGQAYFSNDGSITLDNIIKHMGEARKKVDDVVKKLQPQPAPTPATPQNQSKR